MAEELIMNVKSNIKSVTKETKDWGKTLDNVNESLNIQNKVITDLEKDLIKLKAKQDSVAKGAWVAGMDKINDKIRETSSELKLEKNALKDLKNQQKEATTEVKKLSNAQKGSNKESKESIANFQFMGVSLNGVKKGFSQVIPTAKAMFGTIKAGIMSTGIGALVLAVIALTQSFKRSEAGQEKFQRIMAAIGAVTSQVLDAFSDLGELIIETFQDPMPAMKKFGEGLLKFLKDPTGATRDMFIKATLAAKDFTDETGKEVDALIKVTNMRQKAHHIDRKLKVERAKANREINDLRLKAEDRENQSATDRIALLRKAQAIEEGITAKEIQSKQILIDAQVLFMKQGHNDIAQKDKLAKLQAELINLDTKKLRGQRLLQTQITTALNEEKAGMIQLEKMPALVTEINDQLIQADANYTAIVMKNAKKRTDYSKKLQMQQLSATASFAGALSSLAGENKQLAAAESLINTYVAVQQTMADKTIPSTALKFIMAGTVLASGLANVKRIFSTNVGTGGGGGGGGGAVGGAAQAPAPQMMSGAFDLTGGIEPEPVQAFVVTDEMTNSQNQLANIRRRATI